MKIKITKNIEKEISLNNLGASFSKTWDKYYKFIFFIVILCFLAYISYVWYDIFYTETWSDEERAEYMIKNSEKIDFDKDKYKEALDVVSLRKQKFNSNTDSLRDIFE